MLPLHRTSFDVPVPDVWSRRPAQTGKLPLPRRSVHPLGKTGQGTGRPFSEDEDRASHLAQVRGLSLTDLSNALRRDVAVVSKHAIRLGVRFSVRTVRAPKGPRKGRLVWSLASILALGESDCLAPGAVDSTVTRARNPRPAPVTAILRQGPAALCAVALPTADLPNAVRIRIDRNRKPASGIPSWMLPAMQAAGLLRPVGRAGKIVLLTVV